MKQNDCDYNWKASFEQWNKAHRKKKNANGDRNRKVRGLYFDSCDIPEGGVPAGQEKFRIEYYNDDLDFICLEKLTYTRGCQQKQTTAITKEECQGLLEGDISFLKNSENLLYLELYAKMHYQQLRPRMIVDYRKGVFLFPMDNLRITVDPDLGGSNIIKEFLSCEEKRR